MRSSSGLYPAEIPPVPSLYSVRFKKNTCKREKYILCFCRFREGFQSSTAVWLVVGYEKTENRRMDYRSCKIHAQQCKFKINKILLKVNNRNFRTMHEICSKLAIKIPDTISLLFVNFEHISHLFLVFLLLTLNM